MALVYFISFKVHDLFFLGYSIGFYIEKFTVFEFELPMIDSMHIFYLINKTHV